MLILRVILQDFDNSAVNFCGRIVMYKYSC